MLCKYKALCEKGPWRKVIPREQTVQSCLLFSPWRQVSERGEWQLGLWHRQENYNLPGYNIDANSYLRLNKALDTPKAKHIPKHLLFLRDFTKDPSGVAKDSCKSLGAALVTPYCTGSVEKKKKKSCNFAKSPRGWGKGKKKNFNFGKDLLLRVQKRLKRSQHLSLLTLSHFH